MIQYVTIHTRHQISSSHALRDSLIAEESCRITVLMSGQLYPGYLEQARFVSGCEDAMSLSQLPTALDRLCNHAFVWNSVADGKQKSQIVVTP